MVLFWGPDTLNNFSLKHQNIGGFFYLFYFILFYFILFEKAKVLEFPSYVGPISWKIEVIDEPNIQAQ